MNGFLEFKTDRIDIAKGPTTGFAEGFDSAFQRAQLVGEVTSKSQMEARARKPLEEFLPSLSRYYDGSDPAAPQLSENMKWRLENEGAEITEGTVRELIEFMDANGVEYPDAIRPENLSAALQEERARTVSKVKEFDRTLSRAGFAGNVGAFAGEMGASVDDIETIATMPFGASARAGILATALIEGGINAAAVTATQGDKNAFLQDLGLEPESAAWNAAVAFVGGAAIGGGIKSLERFAGPAISAGLRGASDLGRSLRGTASRRALVRAGSQGADPLTRGLAQAVRRDLEDFEAAVTVEDPAASREFQERATIATEAGHGLVDLDIPDRPAFATARRSIINGEIEEVDPRSLAVQPDVFQFKSEIVAEGGVTPKLLKVTNWMPERAGVVLVYQYADGTRAIADGHQRTALANRIMAQDPSQRISMAAKVFKEEDGFTPEDIRVLAALKNISEAADGMTSRMALDAAKVLRIRPDAVRELPAGPGIVRARELSNLSDDAFDMVINRVVREDFAALVGRMVQDKRLHDPIMRLLAKTDPDSSTQAESIIAQAMEAPMAENAVADLFGDQTVVESLYLERAKVLERAMRMLREDRQVFRTLTDRTAKIEGAGNRLDGATNKQVRETVEKALAAMKALAHRSGPISEALNDAAKSYRDNGKLGNAAEQVARIVRDEISRNGLAGAGIGASRRDPKPTGSGATALDPNVGFDDPDGPAAIAQVDATRIEPGTPRPVDDTMEGLQALILSGATPEQIEAHPMIVDALAAMEERAARATDGEEGYGSPEWHSSREYRFGSETVIGTDAALARWADDARAFAGPEGVAYDRVATIILGPPAAGKSTIAENLSVTGRAAIIDSDEIKKTLPEYEGGVGAARVHEESSELGERLEAVLRRQGANAIIPKVGGSPKSIRKVIDRFQADGYTVRVVNMAVTEDEAYRRMIGRFIATGRIIPPEYVRDVGEKPSATFRAIKKEGKANGYAEIDNNGPFEATKPIREIEGDNPLAGSVYDLPQGRGEGVSDLAGGGGAPGETVPTPRLSERTQAGDQTLIDGVAPITDRDRLQARAAKPLQARPRGSDTEIGGLFDPQDPARFDLFDAVPVGRGFDEDGNEVSVVRTREEIAAELDEDDAFVAEIENCLIAGGAA